MWFTASGYPEQTGAGPGPDFFPQMAAIVLALLAFILFFQKAENEEASEIDKIRFSKQDRNLYILIFIAFIVFIIISPYVGFFVSATLFIIAWMFLMKERNWKFVLILSIGFSLVITVVFEFLLGVPIPHGFLY